MFIEASSCIGNSTPAGVVGSLSPSCFLYTHKSAGFVFCNFPFQLQTNIRVLFRNILAGKPGSPAQGPSADVKSRPAGIFRLSFFYHQAQKHQSSPKGFGVPYWCIGVLVADLFFCNQSTKAPNFTKRNWCFVLVCWCVGG